MYCKAPPSVYTSTNAHSKSTMKCAWLGIPTNLINMPSVIAVAADATSTGDTKQDESLYSDDKLILYHADLDWKYCKGILCRWNVLQQTQTSFLLFRASRKYGLRGYGFTSDSISCLQLHVWQIFRGIRVCTQTKSNVYANINKPKTITTTKPDNISHYSSNMTPYNNTCNSTELLTHRHVQGRYCYALYCFVKGYGYTAM